MGGGRHSFRTEVTDDMGREAKAVVLVLTLALQTRVRPYNFCNLCSNTSPPC